MLLIFLIVVDGAHIGHGWAVEASGGHGGVEFSQTDAEGEERLVENANVGDSDEFRCCEQ